MAMERMRSLRAVEQLSRNVIFKGSPLAVQVIDPVTGYIVKAARLFATPVVLRAMIPAANIEVRTPLGLLMDPAVIRLTPEEIDARAAGMDALFEIANPRTCKVQNLSETVKLAAGSFPVAGSKLFGDQTPSADRVTISAFEIGKYPVTVAQYREFYEATDHGAKIAGQVDAEKQGALVNDRSKDNHPMVYLTQAEKEGYPAWLKKQTGDNWDLLTAAEMEYVMRGQEGRTYPWGNEWKQVPYRNTSVTAPVDSFPGGATSEGIAGLGIVWEATKSFYGDYDPNITDNPQGPLEGNIEVRGGSAWYNDQLNFRGALRDNYNPDYRDLNVGFRLAKRT